VSDVFSAEEMLKKVAKFHDCLTGFDLQFPCSGADLPCKPRSRTIFRSLPYYELDDAPEVDGKDGIRGSAASSQPKCVTLEAYSLPQVKHVTRHNLASRAGARSEADPGTPLRISSIWRRPTTRQICWFQCADREGYHSPLSHAHRLHPQTQMTFNFVDEILPRAYGFP